MKASKLKYIILAAVLMAAGGASAATQVVEGETGSGAKYLLTMPDDWNGDLVVYAHGIVLPAMPIALPTVDDVEALRDLLTDSGYAMAYSSYSKNGFAIREGVLEMPHLALHNSRDPAVPVFHQALYADAVAEQGDSDLLVQRITDRYGHTSPFTNEVFGAFTERVDWVDTGVSPIP